MRAADAATIARMLLAVVVAYFVVVKFDAVAAVLLFAVVIVLDAVDGFLAIWQESRYRFGLFSYVRATLLKDRKARELASKHKRSASRKAKFGPRMDIAGDRFVEYAMWITFSIVGIVPLFLLLAVVMRHSIADALMGAKGTSSKMRSRFAKVFYTSNASRAAVNIMKALAFGYLILMYIEGYPAIIGYALIGVLFAIIMLRGAAEIYEGSR